MVFRQVVIEGFKSFRQLATFRFAGMPGFYLIMGNNRLHPQLGPNGVGKSSLFDAIVWVLFGKTARGLKAQAVSNWHDQEAVCSVLLEFEQDQKEYTLERRWNPNSIVITEGRGEPKLITQEELEQLIRIDYTGFLHTSLMGQFNQFFFDLTPSEKLKVFSDALDLNHWMERSSEASRLAEEAATILCSWENKKAKIEGSITTLRGQEEKLKTAVSEYEDTLLLRIGKLKDSIRKIQYSMEQVEEEEQTLGPKIKEAESKRMDLDDEREALSRKVADTSDSTQALSEKLAAIKQNLANVKQQLDNLLALKGECPTCLRPITQKDRRTLAMAQESLTADHSRLSRKRSQLEENRDASTHEQKQLSQQLQKAQEESRTLLDRTYKLKSKLELLQAQKQSMARQIQQTQDQIREEKNRPNPHEEQLTHCKDDIREAKEQIGQLTKEIEQASFQHQAYTYWTKGFRDIRLWIVEEALQELELNINNSLMELGLDGWEITLDVERPKQDGSMSRGFTVFIKAPNQSQELVPWESWSGGETQRLRIAGAIGLANLISSRRGTSSNIEVWDEPTAHLSEEGIQDLLTFFRTRSKQEQKELWLVDHHALDAGQFDGNTTVIKDAQGSYILPDNATIREEKRLRVRS